MINDCGLKSSSLIQFWVQLPGMNKGCSAIQPEPGPVSRPVTYSSSSLAPLYFLHQDKGFMNQIPHLHYAMLDRPSIRTNPVHRSSCFHLCASRRNPSLLRVCSRPIFIFLSFMMGRCTRAPLFSKAPYRHPLDENRESPAPPLQLSNANGGVL